MGSFPDDIVQKAWERSKGVCECKRTSHRWHWGPCSQKLIWDDRGKEKPTGWEAHHIVSQEQGGSDTLSNCEILCQRCHKVTKTFG